MSKKLRQTTLAVCNCCGIVCTRLRSDATYCGNKCRQRAYRIRQRVSKKRQRSTGRKTKKPPAAKPAPPADQAGGGGSAAAVAKPTKRAQLPAEKNNSAG